jgi:TonB family protein
VSPRSTLHQGGLIEALWLTAFCTLALFLHGFVALTVLCANSWMTFSHSPLIDPANVMEVSMVVLPKSTTKMVQRNTKKRVSHGQRNATKKAQIPPNSSDLRFKTPNALANQGDPDRSDEMKRLVDMASVLSQIEAPESDRDSLISDPDSNVEQHINLGRPGSLSNPKLAKYIQHIRDLFHKNFSPLPTLVAANPKIECAVHVRFDMNTGKVTTVSMQRSSGNASYDGAALRAVESVSAVPLPPEGFRAHFTDGYLMVFP